MPTYSFGKDSPVKFQLPDKTAEYYNQAVQEYFKAQRRFNQKFGRLWDPIDDPVIKIQWTRKQQKAWNDFARIFAKVLKEQGPFHENDFMDDFLVKNVSAVADKWGHVLTRAAMGGALYVLLRGL